MMLIGVRLLGERHSCEKLKPHILGENFKASSPSAHLMDRDIRQSHNDELTSWSSISRIVLFEPLQSPEV